MHRPSAMENPQAPLSHHYMDSTHITPGVLRGGITAGEWRAEVSRFRGREADENRLDIDLGALDSTAARLSWNRGPWSAQVSGAMLTQPELLTPYDARRLTASVAYSAGDDTRGIAWLASFGQNREIHGNLEAYLFEANVRASATTTVYTRLESVAKSILDAGFHPPNAFHRHRQSQVGALTLGYVRDVLRSRAGGFGAGVDVTGYVVPANLEEPYGSPLSFHMFLRYRAPRPRLPTCPIMSTDSMTRVRRAAAPIAAIWLLIQTSALVVLPAAFYAASGHAPIECTCAHDGSHHDCPMHHAWPVGARVCFRPLTVPGSPSWVLCSDIWGSSRARSTRST